MRSWTVSLVVGLWAVVAPAWAQDVEADPEGVLAAQAAAQENRGSNAQSDGLAVQAAPAPGPRDGRRAWGLLGQDTPVKLPWAEVARLLEQARRARPERAPLPFALGAARIEGEADGRALTVRLELPVHLTDDGWTAIPLWRTPAAVRRATLDGQPAPVALEGGAMVLLARGKGAHLLRAELVTSLGGGGEQVQLGFATPVAASWRLRLPARAARIEPALAQVTRPDGRGVLLEATTSPAETLRVDWTGSRAGAAPSRVSVESFTYVVYREDTTSGRATLEYQIAGAGRDALAVGIPAAMEPLSVEARDLAHWGVEGTGAEKRLVATFVRAQRGRVTLSLGFELPKPAEAAELPVLTAREVDEQRAWLAASAESPVSIGQESMSGGEAVDVKQLPAHLLGGVTLPFTLAWRHPGEGFTGRVRIARHATVALPQATIDAAYFTTVLTEEGQEVVKATFLVKNNLQPYLAVTLPRGAKLRAAFVSGESVNPAVGPPRAGGEGAVLLPMVKSREVGAGENLAVHEVEEGWSLSDLALSYYHDASKWKAIAAANAGVIGPGGQPRSGQSLVIPRLGAGAGASDLTTAFPVEIVYSRENRPPGRWGALALEVPAPDLGVMSAVWTVHLPSRLDPLSFSSNLVQTSYVRYGLLRRLRELLRAPVRTLTRSLGPPVAQAGGLALRKRFSFDEAEAETQAARSRPRVSLPLVGRPYVFKRDLLQGELPVLSAVYLDRRAEPPLRAAALAVAFALALGLLGPWPGRRPAGALAVVAAAFVAVCLVAGHFVLGTHGRAFAGALLGAWVALAIALRRLPPAATRAGRIALGILRWGNAAMPVLVALLGLSRGVLLLGLLLAVPGVTWLWRARRRPGAGPGPVAGTAAGLLLLVLAGSARAADLPPGAEVTVPFSALAGLVGEGARPLPPPREFTALSADYRGTLTGERLALEAHVQLQVHSERWVSVPLVSRAHALSRVIVDGRPAATVVSGGRYLLPLRGAGRHTVELSLEVKADPGLARLELVPGVAGTLTVRLPAAGMSPELAPATEARVDGAALSALLPEDGRAELCWSAPARGRRAGVEAPGEVRMVARTLQIVSPEEQRIRMFAAVRYLVQRGGQSRFAVRLPEGVELLDVQGEGIAEHAVVAGEKGNELRVTTTSLVREAFELSFAYDWKPPRDGGVLPAFEVLDVRSETGVLGIEAAGNLALEVVKVDGAADIDVRSAPELLEHTDKPILHAVRYLQHPYAVQVAFERHPEQELDTATVDRASYTTVMAADGKAITRGVYRMRNARQPFLALALPREGGLASELESVIVGGEPTKPVRDEQGRLLLPLMRSPSAEREMRQFEVEVVYLTRVAGMGRSGEVPALLAAIDLPVSEVEWSLYLPPGSRAAGRQATEAAEDHMQWATAPRAIRARPPAPRSEGGAVASGGMLPVRFDLPEHGTPETFWRQYLPAGVQPAFRVAYAPRSVGIWTQLLVGVLAAGLVAAGILAVRRRRA
jgi:hypothetical protein